MSTPLYSGEISSKKIPTLKRNDALPLKDFQVVLSVTDKSKLEDLIPLWAAGARFISTGGTLDKLVELGISVTPIEMITGQTPIYGGRIKLLGVKMFQMILPRPGNQEDLDLMTAQGLKKMGLVVMNPYGFEEALKKSGITVPELIENIDIGGGAVPMAALKAGIPVVMNPRRYAPLVREIQRGNGVVSEEYRDILFEESLGNIVRYYAGILEWARARQLAGSPLFRD